jgi:hypothetical protein
MFLVVIKFLLFLILSMTSGGAIGVAAGFGGKIGKNRRPGLAVLIGIILGLVGFITTFKIAGFETAGVILHISMFCAIVFTPAGVVMMWAEELQTSICVSCGSNNVHVIGKSEKMPIYMEEATMNLLQARKFTEAFQSPATVRRGGNYSEITVYQCKSCLESFIEMTTFQARLREKLSGEGEKRLEKESRLVFSSLLEKSDVETLLGIIEKPGQEEQT